MAAPHWLVHGILAKAKRHAALMAACLAGAVYFYNMSPGVTLQDSGELVTAAFTFGVPHPPGYPLWTLLGFLWSHLIVPFGNPAWRIGLLSVVTGALLVGVMALTMIRCLRVLLDSLPWNDAIDAPLQRLIAITVGVSTALLFGFTRGVWYWAGVPEMHILQILLVVSAYCAFLTWLVQPDRRGFLYVAIVLFAVNFDVRGWTNNALAISICLGSLTAGIERFIAVRRETSPRDGAVRTLMVSLSTFWELCIGGLLGFISWQLLLAWLEMPQFNLIAYNPWPLAVSTTILVSLAATGWFTRWWSLRRALACSGLLVAGYSIYLYLPLASATNPPMNWGYTTTKQMFHNMVSGGSYESWGGSLSGMKVLPALQALGATIVEQFSLPLTLMALLALMPLAVMALCRTGTRTYKRAWIILVWVALLTTSLIILPDFRWKILYSEYLWPMLAQAHALYAMLIGLGIATIVSFVAGRGPKGSGIFVRWLCVGLLALPLVSFTRNLPACSQRGHDFGYRFGHLLFEPGHDTLPMEKGAILFAGTDAGRFVATYMIFCESRVRPKDRFSDKTSGRSDVYIITLNALADATYMSYIRDQYDFSRPDVSRPDTIARYPAWRRFMFTLGWKYLHRNHAYPLAPIHILSQEDANKAFKQYVDDVNAGRVSAHTDLNRLTGFGGVIYINGILARWIFDQNKESHAFYVEEGYVLPWMYPHLRPCGTIMKLEKDPLPSPTEDPKLWDDIKARDRAYWDRLTDELLSRSEFRQDGDAKMSFSKLRSAIAGLYGDRGLIAEAEYAFRQALRLCPESRDARYRLADLYAHHGRYGDAQTVIEDYLKLAEDDGYAGSYIAQLKTTQKDDARRQELETDMARNKAVEFTTALELATIYQRLKMDPQFKELTRSILNGTNLQAAAYAAVETLCANGHQWQLLTNALQRHLTYDPKDYRAWIDLASAEDYLGHRKDVLPTLRCAVETGGDTARAMIRQSPRFAPLRHEVEFQSLVNESPP